MSDGAFGRIHGDEHLRSLWNALLVRLDELGPYQVQHHKASLRIVNGGPVLAVSPTPDGLRLTFPVSGAAATGGFATDREAADPVPTVIRRESEIDAEILGRLTDAYCQAPTE